jgi:hypothetical protein
MFPAFIYRGMENQPQSVNGMVLQLCHCAVIYGSSLTQTKRGANFIFCMNDIVL